MKRLTLTLLIAACAAAPAAAQPPTPAPMSPQDSLLAEAIRLITEGQGDSARALVRQRLAATSTFDSLYPSMLFAAGVVAADTGTALNYFRRVSIEYSQSEWADDALLRLAQLNYAAGQYPAALRSSQSILLDYPFSDVIGEARYWTGRIELAMGGFADACSHFRAVVESGNENVELVNRAQYHLSRCTAAETAATPSGDSAAARGQPARTPDRASRVFAVQVAAVRDVASADGMMRSLNAQGYTPHVMRDTDGLLKIRVGRFTTRDEAQQLADQLRRLLGGRPFVVEET